MFILAYIRYYVYKVKRWAALGARNEAPIGVEQEHSAMNIDRAILAFAGLVVLTGLLLSQLSSSWWLLLSAFVGLNMIQAAFSGFCPAAIIFRKLGIKPGNAFP